MTRREWGAGRSASRVALGAALTVLLGPARAGTVENQVMVVYLPGAPIESATQLAGAVTELGSYLNSHVPGLAVKVKPFRRWEDATAFVEANERQVVLVLSDPAFLLDYAGMVPTHRLVRLGRETFRKLVVVKAENEAVRTLSDLRGRSISLVQGGGKGASQFLARVVFEGELVPETWFGSLEQEVDDFSATASVLFGRTDAALVGENNPLLSAHLGKDLRAVYSSPPISMPVVSVRESALSVSQRAAVDRALRALDTNPDGKRILKGLRLDGVRRVGEGDGPLARAGLLRLPAEERKTLEIVAPGVAALGLAALAGPRPDQVPFTLSVQFPKIPMPNLAEAGKETKEAIRP